MPYADLAISHKPIHVGGVMKRTYFICCRDGDFRSCARPRKTGQKRPHQKDTKKLNDTCISRMYVDYYGDGRVTVMYITAHTNHQPGSCEDAYLPLPKSVHEEIAIKLSSGIPSERIMEGTYMYIATNIRQHIYTITLFT